jgi:hypothetical protein
MRGAVITLMARRMASSWPLLSCVLVTTFVTAAGWRTASCLPTVPAS